MEKKEEDLVVEETVMKVVSGVEESTHHCLKHLLKNHQRSRPSPWLRHQWRSHQHRILVSVSE